MYLLSVCHVNLRKSIKRQIMLTNIFRDNSYLTFFFKFISQHILSSLKRYEIDVCCSNGKYHEILQRWQISRIFLLYSLAPARSSRALFIVPIIADYVGSTSHRTFQHPQILTNLKTLTKIRCRLHTISNPNF